MNKLLAFLLFGIGSLATAHGQPDAAFDCQPEGSCATTVDYAFAESVLGAARVFPAHECGLALGRTPYQPWLYLYLPAKAIKRQLNGGTAGARPRGPNKIQAVPPLR